MTLLKFSLDLSKPWFSQYYPRGNQDENQYQGTTTSRDLDKVWMKERGLTNLGLRTKNNPKFSPLNIG